MENFRAGLIMAACGEEQGGTASPASRFSKLVESLLPQPMAYGATDVDVVLPRRQLSLRYPVGDIHYR